MIKPRRALRELQSISDPPEPVLSEDELIDQTDTLDRNILYTETDVSLTSSLVYTSSWFETEPAWFRMGGGKRSPVSIQEVYREMTEIYQKLQIQAADLSERERELQRRESLLLNHQSTVNTLLNVEEDVLHQEVESLRITLREKTKENKRIKAAFNSIKALNDSMRKQLNELSEQNKRLESQSRRLQSRLENLQRKYEYSVSHRGWENVEMKPCNLKLSNQEKPPTPSKASKRSSSVPALKLLPYLMDWITDVPLFLSEKTEKESELYKAPHPSLCERCAKVLPVLLEQFQQSEECLYPSLLRLILFTLINLEHSTQNLHLTSTLRRLGEEVIRKSLFRSPSPLTRFFSSVIILKTFSQVDVMAQALNVLHGVVRDHEGRGLFLKYNALSAILSLLRTGSPGLLTHSLDVLLQMSTESCFLPSFLDACGTDQFFRCAAHLLRNPRLDLTVTEKLSVLLQKLSCIRKNQRLFEVSSLLVLLQEVQRSSDPSHVFININIRSALFNLGVASTPVHTHNICRRETTS